MEWLRTYSLPGILLLLGLGFILQFDSKPFETFGWVFWALGMYFLGHQIGKMDGRDELLRRERPSDDSQPISRG